MNVEVNDSSSPIVQVVESLYITPDEQTNDENSSTNPLFTHERNVTEDNDANGSRMAEMYKANRRVKVKENKIPFPSFDEPHCSYFLKHRETIETITITQFVAYKVNQRLSVDNNNSTAVPMKITKRKNRITRTRNQVFIVREYKLNQFVFPVQETLTNLPSLSTLGILPSTPPSHCFPTFPQCIPSPPQYQYCTPVPTTNPMSFT